MLKIDSQRLNVHDHNTPGTPYRVGFYFSRHQSFSEETSTDLKPVVAYPALIARAIAFHPSSPQVVGE